MPSLVAARDSADTTACGIATNVQAEAATQGGIGLLLIELCGRQAVIRAERRAHRYRTIIAVARGGDWRRGGRCTKGRAIRGQVDVDAFAGCPWRNRKGAQRIGDDGVDMPEAGDFRTWRRS